MTSDSGFLVLGLPENFIKIERVSIECHKTKTKVITFANQNSEVITRSRHKARENVHARTTIVFGFTSDWLKKWCENFELITE